MVSRLAVAFPMVPWWCRFWHKVLYDIGVVSTKEPFQRLVSQGMILGEVLSLPLCMPIRRGLDLFLQNTWLDAM